MGGERRGGGGEHERRCNSITIRTLMVSRADASLLVRAVPDVGKVVEGLAS
jgi:hypothetical protein